MDRVFEITSESMEKPQNTPEQETQAEPKREQAASNTAGETAETSFENKEDTETPKEESQNERRVSVLRALRGKPLLATFSHKKGMTITGRVTKISNPKDGDYNTVNVGIKDEVFEYNIPIADVLSIEITL